MADPPLRWVEARAYCHATEEEDRVAAALANACPGGVPSRETLEGEHGNPIVHLRWRVDDGKALAGVWGKWKEAGLPAGLRPRLDARLDEDGTLHLRLDKQKAYEGVLALAIEGDTIDVRVKLKAYPAKPQEIRRVARALLEEG